MENGKKINPKIYQNLKYMNEYYVHTDQYTALYEKYKKKHLELYEEKETNKTLRNNLTKACKDLLESKRSLKVSKDQTKFNNDLYNRVKDELSKINSLNEKLQSNNHVLKQCLKDNL